MKYSLGQAVVLLIQRGHCKEGDVLVIDAIHENEGQYTLGFYEAEDALTESIRVYEDEIRPYEKKAKSVPFSIGDKVAVTSERYGVPVFSQGEVIAVLEETNTVIVHFYDENALGSNFPYPYLEVSKAKKEETFKLR